MKDTQVSNYQAEIDSAMLEGLSMVLYRLPNEPSIHSGKGRLRREMTPDSSFMIHTFHGHAPLYLCESEKEGVSYSLPESLIKSTTKTNYIAYIRKILEAIDKGIIQKVVAARVEALSKPNNFDPVSFFNRLCAAYPTAFVSLTVSPQYGMWIGASPEVLVSQSKNELHTYSLAGTRAVDKSRPWTLKETLEQEIVTKYIISQLRKINPQITTSAPRVESAGTIEHLLTTLSIPTTTRLDWQRTSLLLHPTPAVAGMPKRKAIHFIRDHEGIDRELYAGYLGPINKNANTHLYVNLRCMQVTANQLLLYAGCGITEGATPEKEWQESVAKIDTLKRWI